ncbi:MAG: radical SAM family heme chaperone HemW [Verrucomicrobiota bacterium]
MIRHVYIHIPFCHRICPYCAFYKHQPGKNNPDRFVDALVQEARFHASHLKVRPSTLFLGGGTPSLLTGAQLESLFEGLGEAFELDALTECSIEANPKTFGPGKASTMQRIGINRVSLGVQSWNPHQLGQLGRDHSPQEAADSIQILRAAGFTNLSIDLMFSLPGQTKEEWESELYHTCQFKPDHLSCYNLTYEEDTEFLARLQRGELRECGEETDETCFTMAERILSDQGFLHYETSNYALPGFTSRHNQAYWRGHDYLGLGPSAVSTIQGRRWKNLPDTERYTRLGLKGAFADLPREQEELSPRDLHNERIALSLRTQEGLAASQLDPSLNETRNLLIEQNLLVLEEGFLRLTGRGKPLVDAVAVELTL